ncbi:MAG: hypothetical protein CMB80_01150 [Flammeovirgaceae bacterium]|nr:hypothetical protein [Flammeovirgaceae bacterium]
MKLPVVSIPSGIIVYDGPSLFNGKSIVCIATGFTNRGTNKKTGNMLQTWILYKHLPPTDASAEGDDDSVCGTCKHRHFKSCYVNLAQGPYAVYSAYKRGTYPMAKPHMLEWFKERPLRLGSYGDPCGIPLNIWDSMLSVASHHTGYTHAWRKSQFKSWKKYCMASCDTYDDAVLARQRGWKPFYVRQDNDPLPNKFFVCPASQEGGKKTDCEHCKACTGGEYRNGQGNPSIMVHGPSWKQVFFQRGMKLYNAKRAYANEVKAAG